MKFKHKNMDRYEEAKLIADRFDIPLSKEKFERMEEQQKKKGVEKYGMTLEEQKGDAYDWNDMALEELIDLLQYVEKRIQTERFQSKR